MPLSRPTLLGLVAILLWGLLALFTTATAGIPPFQVTAITFAIGGGVGLAIVAQQGKLALLRQPPLALALGIGGLFGYHALYFAALKLAPPAEASLVAYLWPLLIVIFSGLLPGEHLSPRHVLGALIGFAGVGVLAAGRGVAGLEASHLPGYVLAAGCAVVWAAYSVLSRRMASVPTEAVAGSCLITALLAALCHLAFETTVMPDATGWLALIGLGLGPVGLAFFVWDIGMKRGDIRLLGVASYAAPVISTLALVLTGAAAATWTLGLACLLIVAGAVTASVPSRR
ncbi:MAG: DMT family transporter [Beijerinckiaceae bacterium]|jgi:drug/metabolite transporter (DMT)-like permease|nr:DMT family transporter [Beijerinckiaceae bacterium]